MKTTIGELKQLVREAAASPELRAVAQAVRDQIDPSAVRRSRINPHFMGSVVLVVSLKQPASLTHQDVKEIVARAAKTLGSTVSVYSLDRVQMPEAKTNIVWSFNDRSGHGTEPTKASALSIAFYKVQDPEDDFDRADRDDAGER